MGRFFEKKIVRTCHPNNKNSRRDHKKKKKARTRPAEAEIGKGGKIEKAREIEKKGNRSIRV